MASLTGQLVAETYKALLKLIDNDILTASEKQITDGFGGGSNVFIDSQGFLRANKYKVTNGLATQFLKADGSLDSNAYLTSITGAQVITALGYTPVPTTRTITINGETHNLAADNSWTVGGTAAIWGNITGTLSNQTDLQNALNAKYNNPTGTISQYIRGDGTLATFPTMPGGLPTGGSAGQILAKIDATDYNAQWIDNYATQTKNEVKLGQTLTKGTPVYVSSANGTNMIVSAASNTSEALSSKTLGLLETGGATNDLVKCVTFGLLAGLDTSTASAGDPVWLGPNGTLIFGLVNKPYAPAHLVYIGVVTRVQSNNGEIFVNVQNGFELKEIHDVYIADPANNHGLFYDIADGLWKNKSIASALGYTPQAQLSGTGFVKASGTTITYDNSTYLTTTDATSTYQRLDKMVSNLLASDTEYPNSNAVIAALALKADAANPVFTGNMTISGAEPKLYFTDTDQNPDYFIGVDAGFFRVYDQTAGATRFVINSDGNISTGVGKSITAGSFIKDGGTSSQFLMADGSVSTGVANQITGSLTSGYIPKATGATTLGNSIFTEHNGNTFRITAADAAVRLTGSTEYLLQTVDANGRFRIYDQTAQVERLTISSTGNVGIGSISPSGKLEVNLGALSAYFTRVAGDNGTTNPALQIGTSTSSPRLYAYGVGMEFFTAAVGGTGTIKMILTSSGNLGIGTSNPNTKLEMVDSGNATMTVRQSLGAANGRYAQVVLSHGTTFFGASDKTYQLVSNGLLSGEADFAVQYWNGSTYAERMRIFSNGNLAVGTTTNAGYKLDVNGTGRFSGDLTIGSIGSSNILNLNSDTSTIRISGLGFSANRNYGSLEFYNLDTSQAGPNVAAAIRVNSVQVDGSGGYLTFHTSLGTEAEGTPAPTRLTIDGNGAATFSSSVTSTSFIKSGGTSVEFLKADGSVDSTTYQRLDKMVSNLLPSSTEYPNSNAVINALALKADAANPVFTGNMTISGAEPTLYFTDTDQNPDYKVFVDAGYFKIYDQTAGATRFQINSDGNISTGVGKSITAGSFIKESGTASQYLMADGSVSTLAGLVTGSGTGNYITKWATGSTVGNSIIYDNGSSVGIGGTTLTKKLEVITGNGVTDGIRLTYANGITAEGMDITYLNTGATTISFDSLYNSASAIMQFRMKTAGTPVTAMTIFGSGNISINSGSDAGYKLDVNGTGRFVGRTFFNGINGAIEVTGSGYTVNTTGMLIGQYVSGMGYIQAPTSGQVEIWNSGTENIVTFNNNKTTRFYGNIGINTAATRTITTNQTSLTGYFYSGQKDGTEIAYWYYDANSIQFSSVSSTRSLNFYTQDTQRMQISSGGVLGVGVSNPSNWDSTLKAIEVGQYGNFYAGFNGGYAIYFGSNAYYNGGWKYSTTGGNAPILVDMGAGSFSIRNAPTGTANAALTFTTKFIVNYDGYVGIGLTSPQSQLHMNGVLTFTESGYDTVRKHQIDHSHSDGSSVNNNLRFLVSDGSGTTAERFRVNGAGNFLIGSTSDNGYKLQVQESIAVSNAGTAEIRLRGGGYGTAYNTSLRSLAGAISVLQFGNNGENYVLIGNTAAGGYLDFRTNCSSESTASGSPAFRLYANASAYFWSSVTATSFFESSDLRLKTLIESNPIINGIEKLEAKLYEKNGKIELGYFAQDAEKIMPYAVTKNDEGFLNLSYREIHTAKIARLEKEVAELKAQLNLN